MVQRNALTGAVGAVCLLASACAEDAQAAQPVETGAALQLRGGVYAPCRAYVSSAEAHWRAGRATRSSSGSGVRYTALGSGATLSGRVSLVESAQDYFEPAQSCPLPPDCVRTARQPASGLHLTCSLDVADQGVRSYELHIPDRYDNLGAVPLVMELHAGGGFAVPPATETYSGWREVADSSEEPFVMVWPVGSSEADGPPGEEWQTCNYDDSSPERPCPAPGYPNDRDFLIEVLKKVAAGLNIDRRRIYATGLSSGAAMVHTLACKYSEFIAAAAPFSTGIKVESQARPRDNFDLTVGCEPTRSVPIFYAHSPHDQTASFAEGEQAVAFWREKQACASELEQTYESDVDIVDLSDQSYPAAYDLTACLTTQCGDGDSAVAFCEVDGSSDLLNAHGHIIWLGDDFYFPLVQPLAPSLAQWAWDWMRAYSLPSEPKWPP